MCDRAGSTTRSAWPVGCGHAETPVAFASQFQPTVFETLLYEREGPTSDSCGSIFQVILNVQIRR